MPNFQSNNIDNSDIEIDLDSDNNSNSNIQFIDVEDIAQIYIDPPSRTYNGILTFPITPSIFFICAIVNLFNSKDNNDSFSAIQNHSSSYNNSTISDPEDYSYSLKPYVDAFLINSIGLVIELLLKKTILREQHELLYPESENNQLGFNLSGVLLSSTFSGLICNSLSYVLDDKKNKYHETLGLFFGGIFKAFFTAESISNFIEIHRDNEQAQLEISQNQIGNQADNPSRDIRAPRAERADNNILVPLIGFPQTGFPLM
jgi:hypothetical protein